jgi:ribosomal protein S18 acetylase RimI-like enzyme
MEDILPIEIKHYDESLAEGIAQMWNSWDDLWPGSFTRGIPYTAERVKKQWDKISALAILIAIDRRTNTPVGSCTLHPNWRDKEAAYIGTLGVSPEALNKKVGKQLLLESIRICSSMGYTRVDLNTWPGNLRAVPLYKKVGMMWDPEGYGLTMYDYIPGIISHPFCSPFFESLGDNHDWYDVLVRDLTQAPDDYAEEGMAVYPYNFRFKDSSLSVKVDRYARGITAITRTLNDRTLGLSAHVDHHEAICGLPLNYSLEIDNHSDREMHVSILLKGFVGMEFDDENSKELLIGPGIKSAWTVPFHLTSSAPLFRTNIKTPCIRAEIGINGDAYALETGMKIRSPAEIRARGGECLIRRMGSCRIPLTIFSNLDKACTARVNQKRVPSHIQVNFLSDKIELDPYGQGGIMLEVFAADELEEGTYYLSLSLSLVFSGEESIETRQFKIPVFCFGEKEVAIGEDEQEMESIIVTPYYTANFAHEGAILTVVDRHSQKSLDLILSSEIGPPFGINPFRFAERKVESTFSDSALVVSMTASHPSRPLVIEDRAIFEYGNGVIKHEQWISNIGSESHCFQSRLVGRGGGIAFGTGSVYIPLANGVFEEPLGNALLEYPSIPSTPSSYSEGWVAIENDECTIGQLWDLGEIEEIRIATGSPQLLAYPEVNLEPQEKRRITNAWLVLNARNWKDIQRLWRSRVCHSYDERFPTASELAPRPILNIVSEPVILPYRSTAQMKIRVDNPLRIAREANLEVVPPHGWNVAMKGKSEAQDELKGNIQISTDESIDIILSPTSKIQDRFAIHTGKCAVEMEYDVESPIRVVTLGSSNDKVRIAKAIEQGCEVYHVRNTVLDLAASADYGGCLYSLKNRKGVEFVTSSFPRATPRPGAWFENYYGGIQPIIYDYDLGEPLTKARTNKEAMSAKPYQSGHFSGIEISWTGNVQRITRGVQSRLRYLTAAGAPFVIIQWILSNSTTAPIRFYPTLSIDTKLDAELAKSQFLTEWLGQIRCVRQKDVAMIVTPTKNIIWVMPQDGNEKTTGISLILNDKSAGMFTGYFGDNLAMSANFDISTLMPREQRSMLACVYLDPPDWQTLLDMQSILDSIVEPQWKSP